MLRAEITVGSAAKPRAETAIAGAVNIHIDEHGFLAIPGKDNATVVP